MTPDTDREVDLRRLPRLLLRRAPLILGVAAVVAVSVFVLSGSRPDQYAATAKVRVLNPNREEIFQGNLPVQVDLVREVNTQLQLIRSPQLRANVEDGLGEDAALLGGMTASAVSQADIVQIRVTSTSPRIARDAANAFAAGYVDLRQAQVREVFDERATELRRNADELGEQIDALDTFDPSAQGLIDRQNELLERAGQFDVDAALQSGNVEVAQDATLPSQPFTPTPSRDAALAGVLAALVLVAIVVLRDRFDDRLRSSEQAEEATGHAVLASIPLYTPHGTTARRATKQAAPGLVPLDAPVAEAYQGLQTSLRFSSIAKARRSIAITSAGPGEGKTTITANVAVMLAESGLNVAIVSADLRKPTIGKIFGINEREQGLTSVLVGDVKLSQAVVPVDLESGKRLVVLPTGPVPHNPSELLASPEFAKVIIELEEVGADFVLVDCPPVLAVSDPLAVSQHVDGMILVGMLGATLEGDFVEASNRLAQVDADVMGIILNGLPTKGPDARYSYRYGYGAGEKYGE
jgi:capsular exopolysaccharide synthesis family protein